MVDNTVIFTTLGAAGITGMVGYFTARLQAKTTIRQVEGENERLRAEHAEDHLRNRQTTYHMLLDVLRRFDVATWSGPGVSERGFQDFMTEVGHLINGALLFGTGEVRHAATRLDGVLKKVEHHVGIGSAPFDEALDEALKAVGSDLAETREQLVTAMRTDVAPPPPDRSVGGL